MNFINSVIYAECYRVLSANQQDLNVNCAKKKLSERAYRDSRVEPTLLYSFVGRGGHMPDSSV